MKQSKKEDKDAPSYYDLMGSTLGLLCFLASNPKNKSPYTENEISRSTGIPQATISRALKKLKEWGFVKVGISSKGRLSYDIRLNERNEFLRNNKLFLKELYNRMIEYIPKNDS